MRDWDSWWECHLYQAIVPSVNSQTCSPSDLQKNRIAATLVLKLAQMPSSEGVYFQTYSQHTIIVWRVGSKVSANAQFRRCFLSNLFQAWFTVKYDKYFWRVYAKATALPCSVGVYFQTYSKHFIMVLEYNMHYYNTVPDDWPIGTKGE